MPHRYTHHPSLPAAPPYVNGIGNHYVPNPETAGPDHYLRNQPSMPQGANVKRGHTHGHSGATTCQDGHVHLHPGVSSTPIETERGHVHKMSGNTTFDDGHIHQYEAYTSPPIPLPNGYHTHYVEIRTTEDDGHIHVIGALQNHQKVNLLQNSLIRNDLKEKMAAFFRVGRMQPFFIRTIGRL